MAVRPDFGFVPSKEAAAVAVGLVARDLYQLRHGARPIAAALRSGRLRYRARDPGDRWLSIRDVWRAGGGDCEDLAAAVAAELIRDGIRARVVFVRIGPSELHAVVRVGRRTIDPSRWGGMPPVSIWGPV